MKPGRSARRRARTWSRLIGIAVAILVVGLAIPFVFGERVDDDGPTPVDAVEPGSVSGSAPDEDPSGSGTAGDGDVTTDRGTSQGAGTPGSVDAPDTEGSTGAAAVGRAHGRLGRASRPVSPATTG